MTTTATVEKNAIVATVTIRRAITYRQIADWFVTALEGGSNYWLGRIKLQSEEHDFEDGAVNWYDNPATWRDPALKVRWISGEDPMDYRGYITHASLLEGIQKFADKYPGVFGQMSDAENGDYDAGDADLFFQMLTMGEVVYG